MSIPPLARSAAATKSGRMISLTVNGDTRRTAASTIAELVRELDLDPAKVAVERNGTIAPRSELAAIGIADGDTLEIVHFVGGGQDDDSWSVAGRRFSSRLIVGTGKYADFEQNAAALVETVRGMAGEEHDAALAATGVEIYADNCSACHAEDGTGDREQGAPNLTDAIWLYGGDTASLEQTVRYARFGVMPPWGERLTEAEIKAVTAYVHQLGGGE